MLQRFLDKLERTTRAAHYWIGSEMPLYKNLPGDIIVMYHNVLPETRTDVNIRNISTYDIRKQLRYFKKRFNVVSVQEIFETKPSGRRMAITFDDGLVNNVRYAASIIEEEKIPVTFFVTACQLRGVQCLWPDELNLLLMHEPYQVDYKREKFIRTSKIHFRSELSGKLLQEVMIDSDPGDIEAFIKMLSDKKGIYPSREKTFEDLCRVMDRHELGELASIPHISIGSHCVSHHNLQKLNEQDIISELSTSRDYLARATGRDISGIAYPFGSYTNRIVDLAEEAGYTQQLAVQYLNPKDKTDNRLRNRIGLYNDRSWIEQLHQVNTAS